MLVDVRASPVMAVVGSSRVMRLQGIIIIASMYSAIPRLSSRTNLESTCNMPVTIMIYDIRPRNVT